MKYLTVFFLCFLLPYFSYSQDRDSLTTIFRERSGIQDLPICINGMYLLKFRVDSSHHFYEAGYSVNTPQLVKAKLSSTLISLFSEKKYEEFKNYFSINKYYILPVILNMENCDPAHKYDYLTDSLPFNKSKDITELMSKISKIKKQDPALYEMYDSIHDLFTFDDKKQIQNEDCIILPPLKSQSVR